MSAFRERLAAVKAAGVGGQIPAEDSARLTGLEIMQRMASGHYPPPSIGLTLDFLLVEVEEGRALFRGVPGPRFMNPIATVHGGWTAAIMDSALACAVHTTCGVGEASTTVEFKINLVRPVLPDMGELLCEGRVVHRGRNLAVAEATLSRADGKTLAFGTETCSIFRIAER